MKTKQFLTGLFMLISMAAISQSTDHWRLYVNKKKVCTGTPDAQGDAVLSTKAKGKFIVRYAGTGKNDSKRSILIFDTERHELMHKAIGNSFGKFTFNIDSLKAKTQSRTFNIYTTAIPKDPQVAQLVRMSPKLLCVVSWKGGE